MSQLVRAPKKIFVTIGRSQADYIVDGTADDVEIQAALTVVSALGGGIVFLKAGSAYRIATTIVMPENVTLIGERMARQSTGGVTLKTATSVTLTDMFQVTGTTNPSSNADLKHDTHFENLTFDGNNTTTNNVKLTNQDTVKFINCRFIQATNQVVTVWDSTVAPTAATIPGGVYFERCNISPANAGIGIDFQYQTQCWINNCWFTPPSGTPTAHIRFNCSNKIKITNTEFNTAATAFLFTDVNSGGGLDFPCHNITATSCVFNTGSTVIDDNRTHANSSRVHISGTLASGTTIGDTLVNSGNVVLLGGVTTSGEVLLGAGSATTPSLRSGSDTNSGVYFPADDQVAIATAGSTRLFANTTNVGINTTNPEENLDIKGNFQVKDADTITKSYRFRTNGSNLDVEGAGADLFISVWSGADYTGTQRDKLRLESGADIVKAIDEWQFTDGPFGSTQHKIDGAGGVIINETGGDFDTRIEGDTDANLLFIDAGQDSVAIGTGSPGASAKLQVDSTTKGFLPPRMTTTQRDAISSPAAGLIIYNSTTNKLNFYNGTAWEAVTSA